MATETCQHTWWDEGISHVYLTPDEADACGLAKGYRMFTMPELGAGKDPLEALYAVTGGPTAEVLAMVKDDVAPEPEVAPAPAPAPAAEAEEDDGGDLWGDDDDDEAADEENEKRLAAIAEAHRQKKIAAGKLKVVINMSKVILDVKPWDDTTDMKELENLVRGIKHPTNPKAIEWQAGQLEDIGYGIKKLRIMVQVIDDEVSVDDDLVEKITEFEDHVQSCDIFAFNKV